MNIYLKVACSAALFAVWGALVMLGKTDAGGFVSALGMALAALGAIGAAGTKSAAQADPTPAVSATPAPPATPQ